MLMAALYACTIPCIWLLAYRARLADPFGPAPKAVVFLSYI